MTTNRHRRFDIDALRVAAGDKVFARGQTYHASEDVVILSLDATRVLAQVDGSETYRTEVTRHGNAIKGTCTCPAFGNWGFCKHMVATALAANDLGEDADANGALARIRDHLRRRKLDDLVEMIVEIATRDSKLFKKLDIAAASRTNDSTLEKQLRKALDAAIRAGTEIGDDEGAGSWADDIDQTLDAIAGLVGEGRAEMALKLVDHAIDQIAGMIDEIDDSDGECIAVLQRARDIHLAAVGAARSDPIALAHTLFVREIEDDYDVFTDAVRDYADVLGATGLATYRQLAAEAWAKLPPRTGATRAGYDASYNTLIRILDVFAAKDRDVDARIALRAKDLSSPWHYLQLAEFCTAQGRHDEALRRAEEGLWMFEDARMDERLVLFAADRLEMCGRRGDAEAQLWLAFRKVPSLGLYTALRKTCGEAAYATALTIIEDRPPDKKQIGFGHPADFLITIMMHEKRFDAAWAALRTHGASNRLKLALATASEATNPREVLETYGASVDELADSGGHHAYAEASKLIGRMAALRSAPEQAAYVAALKTRFSRKRNFMKMLG